MQAASFTCRKEERFGDTALRCRIKFTEPLMLWQHSASSLIFRSACLGISAEVKTTLFLNEVISAKFKLCHKIGYQKSTAMTQNGNIEEAPARQGAVMVKR